MPRTKPRRQGVSLLELLVVVTLIGIFASTVAMRFGRSLSAEFGSQGVARELSLAMLACQRAAINTGDDHYVEFLATSGKISSYRIMRDISGVATLVDGPKPINTDVTVTTSSTTIRFNFEGGALSSYTVSVQGVARTWQITVVAINGAIRVVQSA